MDHRTQPNRNSAAIASRLAVTNALGANVAPTEAAAWKSLPSWAVVGTDDRVIPPATQRKMAERAGATISEVEASRLDDLPPDATSAAILSAAATIDS